MKYLQQFLKILIVSALGEILNMMIPLPIPGSIYGIVLMLVFLMSGLIKVEEVKKASSFLIEIMPVMFIPAAVGIISTWDQLRPMLIPVLVVIVVTTIFVMVITGKTVDFFIKGERDER